MHERVPAYSTIPLRVLLDLPRSTLVCIARNFTYAPILIEPSTTLDPVERMKKIILFEISVNALALSTKKPFNPILGETYQGEIGGCPIFM
ncbi:MAG: hypothetical protein KDD45_08120 [Bdellovibrionales bacterium]|nr:hypothetical protein [Bdellovibrionales bacterium]